MYSFDCFAGLVEHKAGDKTKVEVSTSARTMSSFNIFACALAKRRGWEPDANGSASRSRPVQPSPRALKPLAALDVEYSVIADPSE